MIKYHHKPSRGFLKIFDEKQEKIFYENSLEYNQNFVCIPFNVLIQQIQYKSEENGIKVILTEESYSSKIDHFAYEEMKHSGIYLGKRVKRGLFQSSIGKLINTDVNGAIGIARKVIGDSVIRQIIDSGFVSNPFKINTFNKGI